MCVSLYTCNIDWRKLYHLYHNCSFYIRYLSRCLLLPCVANSPDVELDVLNIVLSKAVAALPHALRVGKATLEMDADGIYQIRDRIQQLCAENLSDS